MRRHEAISGTQTCTVDGNPSLTCALDHVYLCRACKREFVVNKSTRGSYGLNYVGSEFYPYDSDDCWFRALQASDSMAIRLNAVRDIGFNLGGE